MQLTSKSRTHISGLVAILFVTFLGAFPRLFFALSSKYPLNDGGMFYVMIRDLQSASYSLPLYTSYNGGQIPFVYPPLGFYLAGSLSTLLHISLIDCLRLLPPVLSILSIPAFFLLSQSLLENEILASAASLAFATIPTAFDWDVMGGGLTRALGLIFALLMLYQIVGLLRNPRAWRILVTAITASATLLSHPSTAWFSAYSAVILLVAYGRSRKAVGYLFLAGGVTVLLTSPWWLTVIGRYGLLPFVAASDNAITPLSSFLAALLLQFPNQPLLEIWSVLGLVGLLLCLKDRKWVLPLWTLAVALLQGRGWPAFIEVPFALIVGIALARILSLVGASAKQENTPESLQGWYEILDGIGAKVGLIYIVGISLLAAFIAAPKTSLSQSQVDAMTWVSTHTPAASKFVVMTGVPDSGSDPVIEWFPAFAQRVSVVTPQGYEWEPHEFARRQASDASLQACVTQTTACLDQWAQTSGNTLEYIYLDSPASSSLANSLSASSEFESVYCASEAQIFARRSTTSALQPSGVPLPTSQATVQPCAPTT